MLQHNILRRNPFFALDTLLDHVFSEENIDNHWMRSDIQETGDTFQISIDLPGIKKDQVEVSLEDNRMLIEVKQGEVLEEREGEYIRIERRRQQGYSRRVFQVGKGIDEESIQAKLEDGVLRIELPKSESEQRKRRIELQ